MKRKIRVMLVDDEMAIRNILKMTIPWEEYGMEVSGEAASGIEAINSMEEVEPDLIFADIRMPFMDGLEFSRTVLAQNKDLEVVILTAFDDFAYAQEALRAQVTDFLVKPVDPEEMEKLLKKLQAKIYRYWEEREQQIVIKIENPDKVVTKVQVFIAEQYDKPELNVAYIAKEFGFDRSYLSRMYKEETGEALVDYIIDFRMKVAKKLARSGQKMYLTAEQVGIPDSNYFGKCFKKYVGMSYREYQNKK